MDHPYLVVGSLLFWAIFQIWLARNALRGRNPFAIAWTIMLAGIAIGSFAAAITAGV
jgi:hypothetical protein